MVPVRFVAPVCNFEFNAQPQARRAVAFAMPVEGSFIIQEVDAARAERRGCLSHPPPTTYLAFYVGHVRQAQIKQTRFSNA